MLASKLPIFRPNSSQPLQLKKLFNSLPKNLPPPPQFIKHSEGIILDAVCLNLGRKQWSFLQQNSAVLTDPLTRNVILRSQNAPRLALDFFLWAAKNQGLDLSQETHLTLVRVLVSSRMFDDALNLLRHLIKQNGVLSLIHSLSAVECSLAVCDALVRACTQVGSSKDAYMVIQRLRKKIFWVSIHAWNNLLNHVLVSERDSDRFWRLYR